MSTVTEYLTQMGVPFVVLRHARVQTALGEASRWASLPRAWPRRSCSIGPVHVLAVVPASRRLDMHLVRAALRAHHAHLATEEELGRHFPEFRARKLPALGSLVDAPIVIDPEFILHEELVFAGGTVIGAGADRDLLALEHALVTPITQRPEEGPPRLESIA